MAGGRRVLSAFLAQWSAADEFFRWAVWAFAVSALPSLPKQFSAEIVRSDGDRIVVYIDAWMRRIDMYSKNGHSSIVITRPDKGVVWTLSAQDRTFYETKLPKADLEALTDPDSLCEWVAEGDELIDGRKCLRFLLDDTTSQQARLASFVSLMQKVTCADEWSHSTKWDGRR